MLERVAVVAMGVSVVEVESWEAGLPTSEKQSPGCFGYVIDVVTFMAVLSEARRYCMGTSCCGKSRAMMTVMCHDLLSWGY